MNAIDSPAATASSDEDIAAAIRHLLQRADTDPEFVAPIVQVGDPVLRQRAADFTGQISLEDLERFLALLRRTMFAAPGVGLAAPQVGVPVRIAVAEDTFPIAEEIAAARDRHRLDFTALINPSYQAVGTATASFYEGCLSFDGFHGVVERHSEIEVSYHTPSGEPATATFTGWQARILQHECDHLAGTVYVDKMLPRSLTTSEEYARLWSQPTVEIAAEHLGF